MLEEKDFGPIYKRMLSHCLPYSHAGPWQALQVPDDVRCLPASPDDMIGALRQKFSDAQLLEAGVAAVMDESMAIQPAPVLCGEDKLIIALRKTRTSEPFELLTAGGILSGRMLPICASSRDERVRNMIQATKHNVLCVSTSLTDLAVLSSLKIPATLATGLADLSGSYLQQVQEEFHLCPMKPKTYEDFFRVAEEEDKKESSHDFVLVGCSLTELSLNKPEGLSAIASHLAGVEEYIDVPLDRFYVWYPTMKAMNQIGFCLKHADRHKVRDVILESIDLSTGQLIAPRQSNQDDSPRNLEEAIQRLSHLRSKPRRNFDDERLAWEDIQHLIKRDSIGPLQQAAEDAVDPIERDFLGLATMNGQILYPQFARLILKSNTENKNTSPGRLTAFSDKEFRQVMQLTERQRKLLNDIADYQKNPTRRWK